MSTLIIHRKVTCCQTSVKQPQMNMKIGILININMTKSNIVYCIFSVFSMKLAFLILRVEGTFFGLDVDDLFFLV